MSEAGKQKKKPDQNVTVLILRCPVTLQSARLGATGTWNDADEDDQLDYPEGWGRVVIRIVVSNPDYADHARQREEHIAAGMAQVQATEGEAFDAVKTRVEIEAAFDRIAGSEPPETTTMEIAWDVSADGRKATLEALAGLGFPVGALPGVSSAGMDAA
jgi:hypothetical protein